jgi:hypothetical protein
LIGSLNDYWVRKSLILNLQCRKSKDSISFTIKKETGLLFLFRSMELKKVKSYLKGWILK